MKYLLIGSETAVLGFSMVGVEGIQADSEAAVRQALEQAFSDKEVGIVIMTETAADLVRSEVNHYIFTRSFPLILEIPDAETVDRKRPTMRELAHRAIGISL